MPIKIKRKKISARNIITDTHVLGTDVVFYFSASDLDLDFGNGPSLLGSWTHVFRGSNDNVGALVTVVASSLVPRHAGWRKRQRFAFVLFRAR